MPLDLEEQEQLDSLKAFWEKYRSLIMGVVTAVLFVFAAYNGWQWWKNSQATEAGKLYETMMSSIEKGNKAQSMQAADDLQKQFAGTSYAPMASLIAAKLAADAGDAAKSQAYLRWVAEKAANDGYQALGKLRLATALMDEGGAKSLAEADTILKGKPTLGFEPLWLERRGDWYLVQGKNADARTSYLQAWKLLEKSKEFPQEARSLLKVKLDAVGGIE
ncbi:YfgM family protein [Polynucleobacter difficilis]|uniref:YfgM family protein n=1 Tax=Polynucleobacter difficilis TaxID=556054 RepID=UPI000D3D3905|nr:tetratricopeptide repeat protein [Polynucleobacter difficilis]